MIAPRPVASTESWLRFRSCPKTPRRSFLVTGSAMRRTPLWVPNSLERISRNSRYSRRALSCTSCSSSAFLDSGSCYFCTGVIFLDSLAVARQDPGIIGALALGWTGVTAVIVIAFPYKTIITFSAMSYLYWYFSGIVAASRMRAVVGCRGSRSVAEANAPSPDRKSIRSAE